jgi:hypothetical protein
MQSQTTEEKLSTQSTEFTVHQPSFTMAQHLDAGERDIFKPIVFV